MESKIQPILCCVGNSVAGRPTQFLMERAFTAAQCDWRVLTVEVSVEDFPVALAGMKAMRFAALRFFPGLQQLAAQLLVAAASNVENSDLSTGKDGITSAMLSGNTWTSWDNLGFGILKLVKQHVELSRTVVWLHGNTRLTRSAFVALQTMAALKTLEQPPARVILDEWPSTATQEEESSEEATNARLPDWAELQSANDVGSRLQELLSTAEASLNLFVIGESLSDRLPAISQLQVERGTLLVASNELLPRSRVAEVWPNDEIVILTESEQYTASEAYDFERWSSQPADLDLFRDAYDEYADF